MINENSLTSRINSQEILEDFKEWEAPLKNKTKKVKTANLTEKICLLSVLNEAVIILYYIFDVIIE